MIDWLVRPAGSLLLLNHWTHHSSWQKAATADSNGCINHAQILL
jgi:hypothetical protein